MKAKSTTLSRAIFLAENDKTLSCHLPYLRRYAERILQEKSLKLYHHEAHLLGILSSAAIGGDDWSFPRFRAFELPLLVDLIPERIVSPFAAASVLRHLKHKWPNALAVEINLHALDACLGTFDPQIVYDNQDDFEWIKSSFSSRKKLIIGFSGSAHRAQGMAWPMFYRSLSAPFDFDLIYLRDYSISGYIEGVRSAGTLSNTVSRLCECLTSYSEVVFVGCSMGAYGALLLSSLMQIPKSKVILLAGPTTLSLSSSFCSSNSGGESLPHPFHRNISQLPSSTVRQLDKIASFPSVPREVHYFYGIHHPQDSAYANYMSAHFDKELNHIRIHEYDSCEHTITKHCLPDGTLVKALCGLDVIA